MGTSATAIGIHGTPTPSSLGTRASHGCIRMSIPEAEWLYDQIEYGTSVVIR
jgi:lipoprotein-anchoring transpeptidase ErfK/SrfK